MTKYKIILTKNKTYELLAYKNGKKYDMEKELGVRLIYKTHAEAMRVVDALERKDIYADSFNA